MSSYASDRAKILFILGLLSIGLYFLLEGLEVRTMVALIPVFLGVQMTMTDVVDYYLARNTNANTKWFNILMAPGTILHETSHLIAVLVTGCYVNRVNFFRPNPKTGTLGYVSYSQPVDKWTVMRDIIVSFAPFFGCGLFLLLINLLYGGGVVGYIFEADIQSPEMVFDFVFEVGSRFFVNLSSLDPTSILSVFLVYLQATFAFGAASSTVDFKGSFTSLYKHPLSTLFLVILTLFVFNLSRDPYNLGEVGGMIASAITYFFSFILVVLVISEITLLFSIPALVVGVEFMQIRGFDKIVPPATAFAVALGASFLGFNVHPIFFGAVFAAATFLMPDRKQFLS